MSTSINIPSTYVVQQETQLCACGYDRAQCGACGRGWAYEAGEVADAAASAADVIAVVESPPVDARGL